MNAIPKRKWRRSEILLLVVPSLLLPLAWLWSATRPAPVPPPPLYDVTDLGILGGAGGRVTSMNDDGDVVGSWGNSLKNARPFVMRNGEVQLIGTGKGYSTTASDVNNVGEVVGTMENADGMYNHAFSWRNGKLTFLPSLGGKRSSANAINERGQIVGDAETLIKLFGGGYEERAVLWEKGRVLDLNVPSHEYSSSAKGINNVGEIVGRATDRSFLWRNGTVIDIDGANFSTCAIDINNNGTVVGYGSKAIFLWRDGRGRKVQMPSGMNECIVHAINNVGQSVGYAVLKWHEFAFLYQNDKLYNLNTLTPGSGWNLITACAINERGQIVGMGKFRGRDRGFLLTPITR